jgi:hypothetical protein
VADSTASGVPNTEIVDIEHPLNGRRTSILTERDKRCPLPGAPVVLIRPVARHTPNYGVITSADDPRMIQFVLKLKF